ncbi:MAG: outer membrane protein assembly factor BamB family protein [Planctomycetota bacterium]|jgi:outer membrane protein assembly factor BamB
MNKNIRWLLSLLFGILLTSIVEGQQWTRFRGPNGQGISQAKTIPVKWTEKDFNWKVKLPGGGHGSPVIWKDKVFLTCEDPDSPGGLLLALGTSDGQTLWSRPYKLTAYRHHGDNSLATSTPVVDADHVYVLWQTSREVILAALDHNGRQIWQRDFPGIYSRFGPGTSPAVFNDIVVFTHEHWAEGPEGGQHQSSWIALDRKTGRTRWTTKRSNTEISYSTPCVYSPEGHQPQLIFASWSHGITGIEPQTGRVIWEVPSALPARVVSSPIIADDLLIGTCGKGGAGKELAAVRPGSAENPARAAVVYKCTGKSAPYVPTPLAKDDLLFTFHDQGDVSCLRIESGQVLWCEKPGGRFYGSPIWINGSLYCINRAGDLIVIKAAPTYELLAVNPLGEKSQATPAVAAGTMYLRTWSHLISIGDPSVPATARPVAETSIP